MIKLNTRSIFRSAAIAPVMLLGVTVMLAACGGGGGDDRAADRPVIPPDNPGIASFNDFSATADSLIEYQIKLALNAFDSDTGEPAVITKLNTTEISSSLGREMYSLDALSCTLPTAPFLTYSVVALFDRSSSVRKNDLGDKTLVAARSFIELMTPADKGIVAAFPQSEANNRLDDPVTFFNTDFTSDHDELLTAINSVGAPDGRTPLWDSMQLSLEPFDSATGNTRALLVLSDGADTDSFVASPATIVAAALAANVEIYAINLRNNNAQQLNSVALDTGGSVFSTDDELEVVAFYESLGKILSDRAASCDVSITVSFEADPSVGDVGYGPVTTATTQLQFAATTSAGDITVAPDIDLPFKAGALIGQTTNGTSVFETDILVSDGTAANCLVLQDGLLSNRCLEPVWATVCDTDNPGDCQSGVVQPDASLNAYANSQWEGCPWNGPFNTFEATIAQGDAPNKVFTAWSNDGNDAVCTYSARGPF